MQLLIKIICLEKTKKSYKDTRDGEKGRLTYKSAGSIKQGK
jgi:hypothetical protein